VEQIELVNTLCWVDEYSSQYVLARTSNSAFAETGIRSDQKRGLDPNSWVPTCSALDPA